MNLIYVKICKPLTKIWKKSLAKNNGWNKTDTLIIEDTFYNCRKNYSNCIIVPEYNGDMEDTTLIHLSNYIREILISGKDVRTIDKRNWLL